MPCQRKCRSVQRELLNPEPGEQSLDHGDHRFLSLPACLFSHFFKDTRRTSSGSAAEAQFAV